MARILSEPELANAQNKEGQHINASPEPKDILRVEADLIEAIHPIANTMRPAAPSILQADTRNIFEQFRTSIHLAHGSRYAVKLADGPII